MGLLDRSYSCFQMPLRLLLCLFFLSISVFSYAIERSPWFPTEYELQAKAGYLFEYFRQVASSDYSFHKQASNHFYNFNIGGAYYDYHDYDAYKNWYAEADLIFLSNHKHRFGMDSISLGGRYQLMDDVGLEDPFSLVAGAFLSKATKPSLHNLGSFHHGQVELGMFLSAGKEFDCGKYWVTRGWGSLGAGLADVGSPWLEGSLHVERNYRNIHCFMLSIAGLYGLGGNNLHPKMHFKGYGPIKHGSLDLNLSYAYTLESEGIISICYIHRLYARNFPANANMFFLNINYPFSL